MKRSLADVPTIDKRLNWAADWLIICTLIGWIEGGAIVGASKSCSKVLVTGEVSVRLTRDGVFPLNHQD